MDNEVYRDLSHCEMQCQIVASAKQVHPEVYPELRLPSGHRADVLIHRIDGIIEIVEVKDYLNASLIHRAYNKYYRWCNYLWIATSCRATVSAIFNQRDLGWGSNIERVGMLIVDREKIEIVSDPLGHRISAKDMIELTRSLNSRATNDERGE